MPPSTDTSIKREYSTTIFTYFGPFRQGIPLTWMEYTIFSINFGLKTKMSFTVINKKILKLIFFKKMNKKKNKPKGWLPPTATLFSGGGDARTTPRGGSDHLRGGSRATPA
jgi:hypothetical protein